MMLSCTVQNWCNMVQAIPCRIFSLGIFRLAVYWCNHFNAKMKRGCPQPIVSPRSAILITSKAFCTHETVERCHWFDHKVRRNVNRLVERFCTKPFKSYIIYIYIIINYIYIYSLSHFVHADAFTASTTALEVFNASCRIKAWSLLPMALTCLHWNNHASKVNNGGECSQYIDSTLLEYHTKLDNTCTGQTPRNALTVVAFGSHCCDLCFANRLSIVEQWRLTWWQNEVGVPGSSHNQCHQCHSPSCSQRYCATPHLYLNRIPGPLLPCNWIITLELVQTSLKLLVSFTEDIRCFETVLIFKCC